MFEIVCVKGSFWNVRPSFKLKDDPVNRYNQAFFRSFLLRTGDCITLIYTSAGTSVKCCKSTVEREASLIGDGRERGVGEAAIGNEMALRWNEFQGHSTHADVRL
jgi:hypothetical protein